MLYLPLLPPSPTLTVHNPLGLFTPINFTHQLSFLYFCFLDVLQGHGVFHLACLFLLINALSLRFPTGFQFIK